MQDEIEGSFLNKHFIQYCPLSQWSQNEQVDGMIWVWPICCLPSLTVLNQNQDTKCFSHDSLTYAKSIGSSKNKILKSKN